jgi:uncharacterized membrane protein YkvA (DUF1232 family)
VQRWVHWGGRALRPHLVDLVVLYHVATDPGVPLHHRLAPAAAVVYVISPFDVIPDFIPILGLTDDWGCVALAIARLQDFITYVQGLWWLPGWVGHLGWVTLGGGLTFVSVPR